MQGIYLKEYGLKFVKTCFSLYSENLLFVGIFFAAILFLLIRKKEMEKQIAVYILFLFVTIFNPVLVNLFFRYVDMDEVYYRFFWLLPINFVVSYLLVRLGECFPQFWKKLGFYLICVCIVGLLGVPVISLDSLTDLPDNLYKVSDEVLEISEYIHRDAEDESPILAVDNGLLMVLRQYDPSLRLSILRDYALCWSGSPQFQYKREYTKYPTQEALMNVLYGGDTAHSEDFLQALEDTKTEYLVFSKNVPIQEYISSLGMNYVAETESYLIYCCIP